MFDGVGFTEGLKLYIYKNCLVAKLTMPILSDLGTVRTIKCVKSRSSKVVFLDPLVILIRMRVLISLNKY